VVTTLGGRAVAGRLVAVGADFLALRCPPGRTTLVVLAAVAWVRPAPEADGPGRRRARGIAAIGPDDDDGESGAEGLPSGAALADVLAQAVAERPRVAVWAGGASLSGELRAAGMDLVVLEAAGAPPALAYVRLASLYEISFLDSG